MKAVRTLMSGIIDYAGLFPPARLDMGPTVANYAAYLAARERWMLGRLIVPVARLPELETAAAGVLPRAEGGRAWRLSALTAPAGDDGFADDLATIRDFNARHGRPGAGAAVIETIECPAASVAAIEAALAELPGGPFPYFEIANLEDPRPLVAALAGRTAAAKIRTGGVTAAAHPPPREVARFLAACALAGVPFKATAGLHHPLRHLAPSVAARQHGFLNVFAGACLLWADAGLAPELEALLAEEERAAFVIDDAGIGWRGHRVDLAGIEEARSRFAHGFGACSFVEPVEDLVALGLLD